MKPPQPLFTPREAARMLAISYPTIKQWILSGKLKTVPTPGGHHRIQESAFRTFLESDTVGVRFASTARSPTG